jgi:hypothetical protein
LTAGALPGFSALAFVRRVGYTGSSSVREVVHVRRCPPPSLPEESGLPPLDAEGLLKLYREMVLIRRVEELAAKALHDAKDSSGFLPPLHRAGSLSPMGAIQEMRQDDYLVTTYREHGRRSWPKACLRQRRAWPSSSARSTGCSSLGLGGSMHMFDARRELLGRPRHRRRLTCSLANGVGRRSSRSSAVKDRVCDVLLRRRRRRTIGRVPRRPSRSRPALEAARSCSCARTTCTRWARPIDSARLTQTGASARNGVGYNIRASVCSSGASTFAHVAGACQSADCASTPEGNGPVMSWKFITYRHRGHSMSDPGEVPHAKGELEEHKKLRLRCASRVTPCSRWR